MLFRSNVDCCIEFFKKILHILFSETQSKKFISKAHFRTSRIICLRNLVVHLQLQKAIFPGSDKKTDIVNLQMPMYLKPRALKEFSNNSTHRSVEISLMSKS